MPLPAEPGTDQSVSTMISVTPAPASAGQRGGHVRDPRRRVHDAQHRPQPGRIPARRHGRLPHIAAVAAASSAGSRAVADCWASQPSPCAAARALAGAEWPPISSGMGCGGAGPEYR